jgi:uncharacterized phage protein (TIGR02220 family)
MDKLQWFKFTPTDWVMGKIQRCPEVTQARFLRLCCLYWNRDCETTIEDAIIEIEQKHFDILKLKKIITTDETDIYISFLDEQNLTIKESKQDKSKSGIVGNLKRWHNDIYKKFIDKEISLDMAVLMSKSIAKVSHTDSIPIDNQSQNIADKIREDKKREDNINNNLSVDWVALLKFFNDVTGRSFKVVSARAKKQIKDRLKEGYSKEDLVTAINNCFNDKYHQDNRHFLTLEFISRSDKMEKFSTDCLKPKLKQDRL